MVNSRTMNFETQYRYRDASISKNKKISDYIVFVSENTIYLH